MPSTDSMTISALVQWAPVVAVLVLLVTDRVIATLTAKKVSRQIDDLWKWHAKEDDEGVKIWYVRRSLEDAIEKLAQNIGQQTQILQQMHQELVTERQIRRAEVIAGRKAGD